MSNMFENITESIYVGNDLSTYIENLKYFVNTIDEFLLLLDFMYCSTSLFFKIYLEIPMELFISYVDCWIHN